MLLLGLLTPQRSIVLAFVYWRTFLPTRYHTPDAAGYHRQVSISSKVALLTGQQQNYVSWAPSRPLSVSTSLACWLL